MSNIKVTEYTIFKVSAYSSFGFTFLVLKSIRKNQFAFHSEHISARINNGGISVKYLATRVASDINLSIHCRTYTSDVIFVPYTLRKENNVSHDTTGKSSLERHNDDMKVGGLSRWFFGQSGGTPLPTYQAPKHHDHDDQHVSEAFASFFKESPEGTEAEMQKIRKDRTFDADLKDIQIPTGYAPVTFIEDDVIVVAPIGKNLREIALENNIPLYGDVMKLLNCRGLGLCTSCRVSADPNEGLSPPNAMEKVHLIRDNPKYRLSCQCEVTGPVKISTKPAKDYGKLMNNFVRNAALLGFFSVIMLLLLAVLGLDVVGKWF